ncbi:MULTISPECIES: antibiotic ABC transporter permease [unclassified Haladaptatus]|uniref:antibiotic ABC transporter permease n=1 Tax=unclassified Haladaptatus TaxID=2622732 RepID=UPI00209C231E|nr:MULTISPECIES: antibiotic ABC transporter permease [unclassified Haladaptatus]MCO8245579.1 antibiotic ABC transporter permease [Haladaptatus sp. AB643]MCO8255407.1 antibiotic ABC transporter permease [Haladaptatus sp. AB618]
MSELIHPTTDELQDEDIYDLLTGTLRYSWEHDYVGYDYFDGMSSRLLRETPVDNKWLNILVQEGIKRSPVNVRPLLLVEQRRSFKGTALFVMANERLFRFSGDERYRDEAIRLAEWLTENTSEGYVGFCGGHRHAMQMLREKRPPNTPNVVPTSYATKALLSVGEHDPKFGETAAEATDFLYDELEYREIGDAAKIKYQPLESGDYYTLNGGALGARLLIDLYGRFDDDELRRRSTKLLDYVVERQTSLGGWYYREPPSASHLSMDNHHNGFIIESMLRYHEVTGTERYADELAAAMEFYRNRLFEADGAPNWDENSKFPKDIHAATQGIIVFSMAGEFEFARAIIDWVLENLYAGDGQFYYQKRRFYTKRFTLMRWCQAWMAYALSTYLTERLARRTEVPT